MLRLFIIGLTRNASFDIFYNYLLLGRTVEERSAINTNHMGNIRAKWAMRKESSRIECRIIYIILLPLGGQTNQSIRCHLRVQTGVVTVNS